MHALEKEITAHSSILAWRIPRTEEPGGLQSMGSQRVGYDRSSRAHTRTYAGTWLHWDYRHDPGPSSPLIPSATLLLSIVACSQSESSEPSCKALGRWEHQEFTGRPHFIALQIQGYFFFKTNWRFVATLNQASLSASFLQQHLLTLSLCATFW